MKKRTLFALSLFVISASIAMAGCGGTSFDDSAPVFGSCRNSMGDDTACYEYMEDLGVMASSDCAGDGGTFSEDPCPTENRIARCTYALDGILKRWTYYEGFPISRGDIKTTCSIAGGDFD